MSSKPKDDVKPVEVAKPQPAESIAVRRVGQHLILAGKPTPKPEK